MKTARFADVVKKCGEPEPHLILIEPAKDRELQSAIKAKRVMTIFQDTVGTKADRGVAGFEPGAARQFLIFPKSLRAFEGKNIVGIKYELWSTKEPPKAERAAPARAPKKKNKPKTQKLPSNVLMMPTVTAPKTSTAKKARSTGKGKAKRKAAAKEVTEKEESTGAREQVGAQAGTIAELKAKAREAMDALEQGKQIAAFNILKRLVDE